MIYVQVMIENPTFSGSINASKPVEVNTLYGI